MRYLPVNLFLVLLLSGCATVQTEQKRSLSATPVWTAELRSEESKNSYHVTIQTKRTAVSGICVLKKSGGEWRGTVMNEFGAKAFDFAVTPRGCRLQNVFPALDKWYIRKTVAADLHFLFEVDNTEATFQKHTLRREDTEALAVGYGKHKLLLRLPDGTVTMTNLRHSIHYSLRKMAL
jgi:uncharacterized protein YceK